MNSFGAIALDTSAYSAFTRGNQHALAALQQASTIAIPVVVLGELLGGFERGRRRERNRAILADFLRSTRVQILPISIETAERYALIYAHLLAKGRPVPTNDLWIAATVMETGLALLTADRHFLAIPHIVTYLLE